MSHSDPTVQCMTQLTIDEKLITVSIQLFLAIGDFVQIAKLVGWDKIDRKVVSRQLPQNDAIVKSVLDKPHCIEQWHVIR